MRAQSCRRRCQLTTPVATAMLPRATKMSSEFVYDSSRVATSCQVMSKGIFELDLLAPGPYKRIETRLKL